MSSPEEGFETKSKILQSPRKRLWRKRSCQKTEDLIWDITRYLIQSPGWSILVVAHSQEDALQIFDDTKECFKRLGFDPKKYMYNMTYHVLGSGH